MIAPALVARFRADLAEVLVRPPRPGASLALAVSGGPDSMAMLALAAAAFPGHVIAATIDHGLRADSANEAALVARWCAGAGVRHATLALEAPIGPTAIHEQARRARYDRLARWVRAADGTCLLTAHHADDQAETFLMRAVRGSGTAGLSGIRARRDHGVMEPVEGRSLVFREWNVAVLRPLLGWRRAELRALVEAAAIPFVDDPSNVDPRFERSRVRATLEATPWLDPLLLARAAAHVGEAHAALEAMTDWLSRTRKVVPAGAVDSQDQAWLDMADLPRELRRRLARGAIGSVRAVSGVVATRDPATGIESLLDAVESGHAANQAGVLVSRRGDVWHFRAEPPRTAATGTPQRAI